MLGFLYLAITDLLEDGDWKQRPIGRQYGGQAKLDMRVQVVFAPGGGQSCGTEQGGSCRALHASLWIPAHTPQQESTSLPPHLVQPAAHIVSLLTIHYPILLYPNWQPEAHRQSTASDKSTYLEIKNVGCTECMLNKQVLLNYAIHNMHGIVNGVGMPGNSLSHSADMQSA